MELKHGCRLAGYLTLAFSCTCLVYAEEMFLPGIGWFVLPLCVLLATAYYAEGKWALPLWVVNTLAVLMCGGMAVALAVHIHEDPDSFAATVPLPIALVPYVGPALIVLLLLKVFRARKDGDAWQLQMMGLLQVALACVLGGGTLLGPLLCAYFGAALWWLALFSLHAQYERGAPAWPGGGRARLARVPWRGAGVPRAGQWLLIALTSSVVVAVFTPRISPSPWNPLELLGRTHLNVRAETGVPTSIDLNRVGPVEVNDEVVMEVQAEDNSGNPKLDLSVNQRWRGVCLDAYDHGRWRHAPPSQATLLALVDEAGRPGKAGEPVPNMPMMLRRLGAANPQPDAAKNAEKLGSDYFDPAGEYRATRAPRLPASRLPDLGPRQYILTFTLRPRKAGGLFVADPFQLLPELPSLPIAPLEQASPSAAPLFIELNGSIVQINPPRGECQYRQVSRPVDDPDFSPPVQISPTHQLDLCLPPPASLRQWTDELVEKLERQPAALLRPGDVTFQTIDGDRRVMLPALREKVARALCDYLHSSGEYTYTLDLRRSNYDLDPTEDFVRNVKRGNCDRYAGALALLCRAVGIPARVVLGYRGCETYGDGIYRVRRSQAHAWVEVLVSRPDGAGRTRLHWLALDPTPEEDAPAGEGFSLSQWWENCRNFSAEFWRVFVLEYGSEEQTALAHDLWSYMTRGPSGPGKRPAIWVAGISLAALALAAGPVAIILLRRLRRRRSAAARARAPSVRFYARLIELLVRHLQLRPAPSQTPREFAELAAGRLADEASTVGLADLPRSIAAAFYRVRYGGEALGAEGQVIDQHLEDLAAALVRSQRVAGPPAAT